MTWLKSLLMRQSGAHSNSLELAASANGQKSAQLKRRPLKRKRAEIVCAKRAPPLLFQKQITNQAGEEPTSVKSSVEQERQHQQQVRLMCEQARSQAIVDLAQTIEAAEKLLHEGGARAQVSPLLLLDSEDQMNMLNTIPLAGERPRRGRHAALQDHNKNLQIDIFAGVSMGPSQSERLTAEDRRNSNDVDADQALEKDNFHFQTVSPKTPSPSTTLRKRTKRNSLSHILLFIVQCLILILLTGLSSQHLKLAAAASSEQQYFEQQPEPSYWVSQGADVRLRCLVRHRQGDCAWLRNGKVVGNINRKYSYAKAPSDGDCSLQIRNASVALDDGHWQCQVLAAELEQDALQTRDSHLVVLVQPERPQLKNLLQTPGSSKLIVEENKPKIVTCEMRGGNPAPQIEWFLDGRNVTKEATQTTGGGAGQRLTQSKIRLAELKRTMNGKNLTCVGVHPTTNQSSAVELDVQYVPSVSVLKREYSIVEGSPLSILCQVDANPAPSLVNWRLVNDGSQRQTASASREALVANKQGPVLDFEHVTRDYNQNVFECLAQNSLGISSPTDVKLNVLFTPFLLNTSSSNSVDVNGEARLSCIFDGNPQPDIKWFYTDPLSRTPTALLVDQQQQQATNSNNSNNNNNYKQHLVIRNVTYRNEGDYHCEARNSINGEQYSVRSSNIALDVFGEPQFLVGRTPLPLKAIQGQKSDIALTFCADPQPQRVYWQFGSIRLEVRSPHILGQGSGHPAAALQAPSKHANAAILQRFQVHGLEPLQKRDSSFSKVPTCFEASMSLLEPELNDQRDYNLFVQSERGLVSGTVRLRVASPLSPALMITSAFVFIVVLFLLALLFLFVFKKRHQLLNGASNPLQPNNSMRANGSARRSANGRGAKEHAINGKHANGISNSPTANGNGAGLLQSALNGQAQQQAKGVVNGAGNGLANETANPNAASLSELEASAAKSGALHHGLMSMASSDTSCTNDQKQLLANCNSSNSDRNSSAGSSTNGVALSSHQMDFVHSNQTDRSSANSSPNSLPMHHISVDDEIQLNGSYQATESVTRGAQLSPAHLSLAQASGASNALIYANIGDYSTNRRQQAQEDFTMATNSGANNFMHDSTSDQASTITMSNTKRAAIKRQQTPAELAEQLGSATSSAQSPGSVQNQHQDQLDGRPSVGATIAMMNSLAAAASPTNGPATGVLNGAINQQLANRGQVRRPGPPKPPKPSIQQRSRFYQQQAAANAGLVMIGNSQLAFNQNHETNSNQIGGEANHQTSGGGKAMDQMSTNELAAEYSRLAFPARAEL